MTTTQRARTDILRRCGESCRVYRRRVVAISLTIRLAAVLTIVGLLGTSCDSPEKVFRDHLYDTYYSTLAKERGDVLTEFVTTIKGYDQSNLPPPGFQVTLLPILEKWIKSRDHFNLMTAKDDSDPRIKPIRDKYIEADNLMTYAVTEWFAFADIAETRATRLSHYSEYAHSYVRAIDKLTEAHDMTEKAMGTR